MLWSIRSMGDRHSIPGAWQVLGFEGGSAAILALESSGKVVSIDPANAPAMRERTRFRARNPSVVSSGNGVLAGLAEGGQLKVVNIVAGEERLLDPSDDLTSPIALSPDGANLIAFGRDRRLHWWISGAVRLS